MEYIAPTDVQAVRRDPKLKVAIGDALTYQGITINTGNGPAANTTIGQDALVRQAFELAIDRQALIDVVYDGLFTPTVQASPPSSPYYFRDIQPPARDVEKAKALLKQAGVPLPVPVTLTGPNNPDLQQVDEVIQSMAQEAGFTVKLQSMEFASSLQAGYRGDFNTYNIGWSGRIDPDGNLYAFLHTGGTFNYGHYSNPVMDDLLDRAQADARPGRAPGAVPAGGGAGAQGPAADLSVDAEERGGDAEGADRVRAGAGRADPAAERVPNAVI